MTSFVVLFLSLNLLLVFLYDDPYRTELGGKNAVDTFHPEWFQDDPETNTKADDHASSAAKQDTSATEKQNANATPADPQPTSAK